MKKMLSILLSAILFFGCFAGCQNSSTDQDLKVETLGVIFEDGKSVHIDMDQEEIRKNMAVEPYNTLNLQDSTIDEWTLDYGLSVDSSDDGVSSILAVGSSRYSFSTTLHVSEGDSVALMTEKLGDPAQKSTKEELTWYDYYFQLLEGQHHLIHGSGDELYTKYLKSTDMYLVSFIAENDIIKGFSVYK